MICRGFNFPDFQSTLIKCLKLQHLPLKEAIPLFNQRCFSWISFPMHINIIDKDLSESSRCINYRMHGVFHQLTFSLKDLLIKADC